MTHLMHNGTANTTPRSEKIVPTNLRFDITASDKTPASAALEKKLIKADAAYDASELPTAKVRAYPKMGQAEEMHIQTRVEKRILKALLDLFSSEESSIEQIADVTEITAECFKREIFSAELSTLKNPNAGDMRTAVNMAKSRADIQYTADIIDKIRLNLLFILSLKRPRFVRGLCLYR